MIPGQKEGLKHLMTEKISAEKPSAPVSAFPFYTIVFFFTLALTAVLTALRTLVLKSGYDVSTGLLEDTALSDGIWISIGMFAAALLLSALIMKRKAVQPIRMPGTGMLGAFLSLLCGAALLSVPVLSLLGKLDLFQGLTATGSRMEILVWLFYLVLVPAAFSFLAGALERDEKSLPRQILAFFPVLLCGLMLICLYFDHSTFMNDSLRVMTQLSVITLMAALLYELRLLIGRPTACGYFILTDFAILVSGVSSVPKLLLVLISGGAFRIDMVYGIFETLLLLYLIVREISVLRKRLTLEDASAKQ